MKLFADTADTLILKDLMTTGMLDGVTTNPSIIAKSGRNFSEVIAEICAICPGPISAEVVSTEAKDMVSEGLLLSKIADNVVIKVPLTREGLIATKAFSAQGLKTNVTLCFSAAQALMAAKAGATYVSPFLGRLDDVGAVGLELIHQIRQLYNNFNFETQILSASVRTTNHITDVALAGSDCATIPPKLFDELYKHPLTDKGLEIFLSDWAKAGQSII